MGHDEDLLAAALSGDVEAARAALDGGANLQCKAGDGCSPLHFAAVNGHLEVAQLLLERGADKEAKQQYGNTPLHFAAQFSKLEVARLLLDAGADKDNNDYSHRTPLELATDDAVRELLTNAPALPESAKTSRNQPVGADEELLAAAQSGDVEAARKALDGGANIEYKEPQMRAPVPRTALSHAAENGHTEVARLLLDKGADKDVADVMGVTPLIYAVAAQKDERNLEVIRLLLERGASTETKVSMMQESTALHLAAMLSSLEVLQLLLNAGADKQAKQSSGETPFDLVPKGADNDAKRELLRL